MIRKTLHSSIFLWVAITFMINGQENPSAYELPDHWYPASRYVIKPFKQQEFILSVPHDSVRYQSRNLIKLPFIIIKSTEISRDWSTIEFSGKLQGKSYKVPFVAPLDLSLIHI